ncbi:MAG: carbamoyltransferase HypF, partial [Anaerolineae bacterium]|nr:carbamoyltransferase HypF [Anaerolineae bacterium]
ARFHGGLAAAIVAAVQRIARESGLRAVALSGGCFQNRLLLAQTAAGLEAAGHEVLLHRQVPANDGGVALGQAAIAAWSCDV